MPGIISWVATFEDSDSKIFAELYDSDGLDPIRSEPIPCEPPISCPFPFENVPFGTYTAALVSSGNRYYYDEGQAIVTAPNQTATMIELDEFTPTALIEIIVKI